MHQPKHTKKKTHAHNHHRVRSSFLLPTEALIVEFARGGCGNKPDGETETKARWPRLPKKWKITAKKTRTRARHRAPRRPVEAAVSPATARNIIPDQHNTLGH
jgi:hypothetical protein